MELLNKIQQELIAPKNQYNSFGKYKYRSCEDILKAVKPLLGTATLVLSDKMEVCGGWVYVTATVTLTDGDVIRTATGSAREPESRKGMDASQITGCASSYARKYACNGLFCIDDTKDADTDEYANQAKNAKKSKPVCNHKTAFGKLPKMTEQEAAAVGSVWLIIKDLKPGGVNDAPFKYEICVALHKKMGHWPITEQEQEEAIAILDKEFKK